MLQTMAQLVVLGLLHYFKSVCAVRRHASGRKRPAAIGRPLLSYHKLIIWLFFLMADYLIYCDSIAVFDVLAAAELL